MAPPRASLRSTRKTREAPPGPQSQGLLDIRWGLTHMSATMRSGQPNAPRCGPACTTQAAADPPQRRGNNSFTPARTASGALVGPINEGRPETGHLVRSVKVRLLENSDGVTPVRTAISLARNLAVVEPTRFGIQRGEVRRNLHTSQVTELGQRRVALFVKPPAIRIVVHMATRGC